MSNKEMSAGTNAEQSTNADVAPSAKLLPNPVLSAAFHLHEIAPYLPYKLKCQVKDRNKTVDAQLNAVYSDGSCTFHSIVESDKGFTF